jgi:hypothetical protein
LTQNGSLPFPNSTVPSPNCLTYPNARVVWNLTLKNDLYAKMGTNVAWTVPLQLSGLTAFPTRPQRGLKLILRRHARRNTPTTRSGSLMAIGELLQPYHDSEEVDLSPLFFRLAVTAVCRGPIARSDTSTAQCRMGRLVDGSSNGKSDGNLIDSTLIP